MGKFSYEEVKEYVESVGCKLESNEYINSREKLTFVDPLGHEYNASFSTFKYDKQHTCPKCSWNRTKIALSFTYDYVKKYIEDKGCKLLSDEYIGSCESKLKISLRCGHVVERSFYVFRNSTLECSRCGGVNSYNTDEVRDILLERGYIMDDGEEYLGTEINFNFHDSEGYKYYSSFHNVKTSNKTSRFSTKNIYTIENIELWMSKHDKSYYLYCDEYKGSSVCNIFLTCKICKHSWYGCWRNIYSGRRGCPACSLSYGERKIYSFLFKNKLDFEIEYEFKDLVSERGNPLRYDFYIKNKNILIEYQGQQHYYSVEYFGGEKDLLKNKIRDEIKRDYCILNNIKLIEIPYWDFDNIDIILTNELNLSFSDVPKEGR
jgi:hypothetical protein